MKKDGKDPKEIKSIASGQDENSSGNNNDLVLELFDGNFVKRNTSRRDFLKVLGFSFASAAVMESCKRPVQKALPYIIQPPEIPPGKAYNYESSYNEGHESSGILLKTRDGRQIKIEGIF